MRAVVALCNLKDVDDALEEMCVDGVEPDGRTKKLVEKRGVNWAEIFAMLSKIK